MVVELLAGALDLVSLQTTWWIAAGVLTSLLEPQSFAEGLLRGVGAASEGVVGVLGADPESPLCNRALTSDFARRSRSAAPENRPVHHHTDHCSSV